MIGNWDKQLVLSALLLVILSAQFVLASKSIDVLQNRLATNSRIQEEEILRVLSSEAKNKTDNFTFVEFVGELQQRYETADVPQRRDYAAKSTRTNPYYDVFSDEIDFEAQKLLQIVPTFDPAAGQVSHECKKQSQIYHRELNKFTLWALKMFDATAKVPSGLLSGNVNQLGDYDECVGVEGPEGIRGQYCLAYLQFDVDRSRSDLLHLHRLVHSHYAFRSNVSDPGHRVPRFSTVNWAVCIPSACGPRDVQASLKDILDKYTESTGLKITVRVDPEMCQMHRITPLPTETLLVGSLFVAIILLALVAGLCDHYSLVLSPSITAFSLKRNILKLISVDRNEGDIAVLHGIRAFNAFMLLLSHKSLALFFNPYVNRTEMAEYIGKPWTVIGRAASLYTDPFIMLSGLLTSYSFVDRLNKSGKLDVGKEFVSRLFRIVPTLGALVLFCTYIMPFIGSGPQWNLVVTQHSDICKKTWWRNFLFIHNYFGFENMCLTHTHHIGIDMQLFIFSPLLVLILYKSPKIGSIILTLAGIFSTGLRFFVTYFYKLNNYIFFGTSIKQLFDTANLSYILPSHRLTVYIIGVYFGYLLRRWPKNKRISHRAANIGWVVSTLMTLAAFIGPAGMGSVHYIYNPIHAALYNAFAPIGWCAIFIWVTFLSHTGNAGWLSDFFSWKGFLITTRLSYAVYLTQFPVFFYNVGETRSSEYIGFIRMMLNMKEFIWIMLTSAILTLLFESPFTNLRNYYLKKKISSYQNKDLASSVHAVKDKKTE